MADYIDEESFMELYHRVQSLEGKLDNVIELVVQMNGNLKGFTKFTEIQADQVKPGSVILDPDDLEIKTVQKIAVRNSLICMYAKDTIIFFKPKDLVKCYEFPQP